MTGSKRERQDGDTGGRETALEGTSPDTPGPEAERNVTSPGDDPEGGREAARTAVPDEGRRERGDRERDEDGGGDR